MIRMLCMACLCITLIFFVGTGLAGEAAYKWVDGQGNVHFTDDLTSVPQAFRGKVERILLPDRPAPAPPSVAATQDDRGQQETVSVNKCLEDVRKRTEKVQERLAEDRTRLIQVNRMLNRETATRKKVPLRQERVALKKRILKNEKMLSKGLPDQERECTANVY